MEGMTLSSPGKCHGRAVQADRGVAFEDQEEGQWGWNLVSKGGDRTWGGWRGRRQPDQTALCGHGREFCSKRDSSALRRKQWGGVNPICLTRRPPGITVPSRNSYVFVHPSSHWAFSNCLLCFRLECTRRYGSQPRSDGLGRKADNQLVQCSVMTAMSKKVEVVWKQLDGSPVQPGGGCQRKPDEGSGVKQRTGLALLWGRWCLGFLLFIWACLALAVTFWRLIYLFLIFKKNVFTYK